jgi:hypothetical protein
MVPALAQFPYEPPAESGSCCDRTPKAGCARSARQLYGHPMGCPGGAARPHDIEPPGRGVPGCRGAPRGRPEVGQADGEGGHEARSYKTCHGQPAPIHRGPARARTRPGRPWHTPGCASAARRHPLQAALVRLPAKQANSGAVSIPRQDKTRQVIKNQRSDTTQRRSRSHGQRFLTVGFSFGQR